MKHFNELSKDSVFNGDVVCYQHKNGYRFSIDSVLLANSALHWKSATILDMGCGCGIIGLILLYKNSANIHSIEGIEYQESLVKLAEINRRENSFEEKLKITHGDYVHIKNYFEAETFSHVICNPPFFTVGSGRPNEQNEAYLARHQVVSTTADLAGSIAYVLKNKGNLTIIYPADLAGKLISLLRQRNIEPKKLRPVYSYPEASSASLALLECIKNGGVGMKILPPLYIYTRKNGEYSEEVQRMYTPATCATGDRHDC